jgi:hypothetical protein
MGLKFWGKQFDRCDTAKSTVRYGTVVEGTFFGQA